MSRHGGSIIRFQLLGPLSIAHGPETVVLKPSKPTSLLAALLLNPGTVVSTTYLLRAVWDEEPPATARAALQTCVLRLRRLFAKYGISATTIEAVPGGYRMHNDTETLDLVLFRALTARAGTAAGLGRSSTGSGRRCRSGRGSRSPTWPRGCSSRTRCPPWNRSGFACWSASATSNWPPGTAIRSWSTSTRAHAATRSANASPSSSSKPSTAQGDRPRHSPSTARCATSCGTSWASTLAPDCGAWNSPSCAPRIWRPPGSRPRGR